MPVNYKVKNNENGLCLLVIEIIIIPKKCESRHILCYMGPAQWTSFEVSCSINDAIDDTPYDRQMRQNHDKLLLNKHDGLSVSPEINEINLKHERVHRVQLNE